MPKYSVAQSSISSPKTAKEAKDAYNRATLKPTGKATGPAPELLLPPPPNPNQIRIDKIKNEMWIIQAEDKMNTLNLYSHFDKLEPINGNEIEENIKNLKRLIKLYEEFKELAKDEIDIIFVKKMADLIKFVKETKINVAETVEFKDSVNKLNWAMAEVKYKNPVCNKCFRFFFRIVNIKRDTS